MARKQKENVEPDQISIVEFKTLPNGKHVGAFALTPTCKVYVTSKDKNEIWVAADTLIGHYTAGVGFIAVPNPHLKLPVPQESPAEHQ